MSGQRDGTEFKKPRGRATFFRVAHAQVTSMGRKAAKSPIDAGPGARLGCIRLSHRLLALPLPLPMKKLFTLLFSLGLLAALGWLGWNTWQATRYFQDNGREARLVIGKRYNASRWMEPVPLKKIHTYTARLEPKYDVLVETDQDLKENDEIFIRFLTRDVAPPVLQFSVRPLVNSIRVRTEADGSPVKIEDTDIFDRLVDKAMGPPAEGVYVRPRAVAEQAPSHEKPTVPFLIGGAQDSTWELIWNNTRAGEWIVCGIWLFLVQAFLLHAWSLPWTSRPAGTERKDFVHPSMRRIDADAPPPPSTKITYVPKPEEEIALTEAERRRRALASDFPAPAPATPPASQPQPAAPIAGAPASATHPTPAAEEVPEAPALTSRETAPPMPISNDGPVLKLRRKDGPPKP